MKHTLTILAVFIACVTCFGQAKVLFDYDPAGNQILRTYVQNRSTDSNQQNSAQLKNTDFKKFFAEDVISYYPNPVQQELNLKWEVIKGNAVTSVQISNMTGQIIRKLKDDLSQNHTIISFQEFPEGTYFVNLIYSDGQQKTIKILKN